MTVGSLFSGIGGFDLGFERVGFAIKWQVELDPFCRAVLAKHWPHVRRYEDVRTVGSELEAVDVLCGGFPCQDVSESGARAGLAGARSGLWGHMHRLISALRPRYVVVENVSGLLSLGMGTLLADLSDLGYDAEWTTLSACRRGAPHTRERVFVVAYADRRCARAPRTHSAQASSTASVIDGSGGARWLSDWFAVEPAVDRMAYGLSGVVDRIRPYGNAILPQEAEWIARQILAAEAETEIR